MYIIVYSNIYIIKKLTALFFDGCIAIAITKKCCIYDSVHILFYIYMNISEDKFLEVECCSKDTCFCNFESCYQIDLCKSYDNLQSHQEHTKGPIFLHSWPKQWIIKLFHLCQSFSFFYLKVSDAMGLIRKEKLHTLQKTA